MFKSNNGIIQFLIVMVFMVASLPMLTMLIYQCNASEFEYLDDKSVYEVSSSIEMDTYVDANGVTQFVPVNLSCMKMDFGSAVSLACINDEYCPVEGRVVKYTLNGSHILDDLNVSEENTLRIVKNWEPNMGIEFSNVITGYATNTNKNNLSNSDMYLVWNAHEECWMITPKFINIYGYTSNTVNKGKGVNVK